MSVSRMQLLFIYLVPLLLTFCTARITHPSTTVKAVNLGGWLVTEGWIKPSLFDGIPNKDLLDGTGVQFLSVTTGKYLCAEGGGGTIIVANRSSASGWETFKLWRIDEKTFNFRVFNKQFVGLTTTKGSGIVTVSQTPGNPETFQILRNPSNTSQVRIKAATGLFWQAKSEVLVTADSRGSYGWGENDPSVFVMSIPSDPMQGEFQVTNGYGPKKAPEIMREHWSTFIVEDDFKFISENGLNTVRIPVGWWIASDPSPPWPYVGGSLEALDNAFSWAEKYKLRVIIDLHAAPGSQNGWDHSSSRDGTQNWGQSQTDENIQQTVHVIEFLTARYAKSSSLYAVELINEPLAPGVSLGNLTKYYKAGYEAVRKHSSTAFVVLSNRLGPMEPRELFSVASGMNRVVIDVHYYNLFVAMFDNMTVQENIDFIRTNRSEVLSYVTQSNGPLTFVGEWVAEWNVQNASIEDYQSFAKAQLEVYGRATFGWAYWTLKNVRNHWSLEWMIKNGYIKI